MKNPCVERGLFRGCAGAAKRKRHGFAHMEKELGVSKYYYHVYFQKYFIETLISFLMI